MQNNYLPLKQRLLQKLLWLSQLPKKLQKQKNQSPSESNQPTAKDQVAIPDRDISLLSVYSSTATHTFIRYTLFRNLTYSLQVVFVVVFCVNYLLNQNLLKQEADFAVLSAKADLSKPTFTYATKLNNLVAIHKQAQRDATPKSEKLRNLMVSLANAQGVTLQNFRLDTVAYVTAQSSKPINFVYLIIGLLDYKDIKAVSIESVYYEFEQQQYTLVLTAQFN